MARARPCSSLASPLALRLAVSGVLAGALLACDSEDAGADEHDHEHESDCAHEDRADAFEIGLSKSGTVATVTLLAADPVPLALGDNSWTVGLTDAGGQPLADATVTAVTPVMPDHGHGTPVAAEINATANPGEFTLAPVNLFMAGLWEVTLDIDAGDATDQVTFAVCVE